MANPYIEHIDQGGQTYDIYDSSGRFVTLATNQTITGIKTFRGQEILRAPLAAGSTTTTTLPGSADNSVIGFRFQNDTSSGDVYLGKFTANSSGDIGFYSNHYLYFRPMGGSTGTVNTAYGVTLSETGMFPGSELYLGKDSNYWGRGYIKTLYTGITGNRLVYSNNGVLSALSAGTSGQYLKSNGTSASPSWADLPTIPTYVGISPITITQDESVENQYNIGFDGSNLDYVSGPESSTLNGLARWSDTTGRILKDTSSFIVNDSGHITTHPVINTSGTALARLKIETASSTTDYISLNVIGGSNTNRPLALNSTSGNVLIGSTTNDTSTYNAKLQVSKKSGSDYAISANGKIVSTDNIAGASLSYNGQDTDLRYIKSTNGVTWESTTGQEIVIGNDRKVIKSGKTFLEQGSDVTNKITASSTDTTIPTSKAVYTAINSALSSSLTYKGTIDAWPTGTHNTGDVYVVSTAFTHDSKNYEKGDMFIYNGSNWDVINGENQIEDKDSTLAWNTRKTIATVDGTDIHVTLPSNPDTHNSHALTITNGTATSNTGHSITYVESATGCSATDGDLTASTTRKSLSNIVTYTGTLTDNRIPVFDGSSGVIKQSSYSTSSFIPYGGVLQPTNPFGGKQLYINHTDDALHAADAYYFVKITTHKKEIDGVTYPRIKEGAVVTDKEYYEDSPVVSTLSAHSPFDGSYETQVTCPNGHYMKVHIQFAPFTDSWNPATAACFSGYPYGYYYLSFYYQNTPKTTPYVRVYNQFQAHTKGWKIVNGADYAGTKGNSGGNNYIARISDVMNYQRSCLEFIIEGKDDGSSSPTQLTTIEQQLQRPNLSKDGSTVTKFGAQSLEYDFTWYKHLDTSGNKWAVQTDINYGSGTQYGTIRLNGLTKNTLVKVENADTKRLVSASKTTPTVLTAATVATSQAVTGITPSSITVVTSVGSTSSDKFVKSYSPSSSNFVTGYTPSTASVVTAVTVKGAVTSVTPTTSKLTTTTITAVGGTVTASQASAGTAKTVLTSINPSTTTLVGVSGTVTASKATAGTAATVITKINPSTSTIYGVSSSTVTASKATAGTDISATVISTVTATTAITNSSYDSTTCTLTLGGSAINAVTTKTVNIPQYTFTDVAVPVKNSSSNTIVTGFSAASTTTITPHTFSDVTVPVVATGVTVVTGFRTAGTTTITPYSFTTVTAATPGTGTVVATGGVSTASTGATVVTSVSSTGTANNLTVTPTTTTVLAGLGTPSTASAITALGNPTTAAALTGAGSIGTSTALNSLGTVGTATVVTSVTTSTTTINNWS